MYDGNWNGMITPESFAHPAKYARGLIEEIYCYLIRNGLLDEGSVVVDPFGGIGAGGIVGAYKGIKWIGCELEPKFVALAKRNFALHRRRWQSLGVPMPKIVRGDSRKLRKVLALADCVVSSPPFVQQMPSQADQEWHQQRASIGKNNSLGQSPIYGATAGQLGNLPAGNVEAVINLDTTRNRDTISTCQNVKIAESKLAAEANGVDHAAAPMSLLVSREDQNHQDMAGKLQKQDSTNQCQNAGDQPIPTGQEEIIDGEDMLGESNAEQQLNEMDINALNANQRTCSKSITRRTKRKPETFGTTASAILKPCASLATERRQEDTKSDEPSVQLANSNSFMLDQENQIAHLNVDVNHHLSHNSDTTPNEPSTFWEAARLIILECEAILRPGGIAVFVCKDFVRKKARVSFSDDWQRLCEACGFVLVERIQASLVKEDSHPSLFGGNDVKITERKSFFRRLAEKKGSPRIDFEDVIVMRKASGMGGAASAIVSSPPYADAPIDSDNQRRCGDESYKIKRGWDSVPYGSTSGQLGSMKPGSVEDAIA